MSGSPGKRNPREKQEGQQPEADLGKAEAGQRCWGREAGTVPGGTCELQVFRKGLVQISDRRRGKTSCDRKKRNQESERARWLPASSPTSLL